MKSEITKLTERIALGALLLLLLTAAAGTTVGLRTSLATLLALLGIYLASRGSFATSRLLIPLSAWVAVTCASALWSWDAQASLHSATYDVLLPVGAMLAAWHLARGKSGTALWLGVLACAPLLAATGVSVVAMTGIAGLYEPAMRKGWLAAYPGVGISTTVAVLVLPFCLAGFCQKNRSIYVMSSLSLCAIVVISVVSQNRAVWPALAFTGGIQTILLLRRNSGEAIKTRRPLLFAILSCCVIVLLAGWYFTLNSRTPHLAEQNRTVVTFTQDVRWPAWKKWAEIGMDHPFLGFGYGKSSIPAHIDPAHRTQLAALGKDLMGHAHNLLLNLWLQLGLLGLAVLVGLVVAITRHLLCFRESSGRLTATIGVGVLIGLLVKNMTDDFFAQALALYFWLLLGIALGLHEADARLGASARFGKAI